LTHGHGHLLFTAAMVAGINARKMRIKSPSQILKNPDKYLGKQVELKGLLFTDVDPHVGTTEGNLLCTYIKDEKTDDKIYLTLNGALPADVSGTPATVLDMILAKSGDAAELIEERCKRLRVVIPGTILKDYERFEADKMMEGVFLDIDTSTIINNIK
jgi:hypothetical protein